MHGTGQQQQQQQQCDGDCSVFGVQGLYKYGLGVIVYEYGSSICFLPRVRGLSFTQLQEHTHMIRNPYRKTEQPSSRLV